jgi:hypothetical protein
VSHRSSDHINIQHEEDAYEALCAWLVYNANRKQDRLADLLALIRLPLLDKKVNTKRDAT